ncbi:MAG: hypothetical protein MZV63_22380 [Marinilabiliales bacterium]|nr:hypothetical protein [Marinilabiliales bacterium]
MTVKAEATGLPIELGALLHDIGDHKFAAHDGPAEIRRLLGTARCRVRLSLMRLSASMKIFPSRREKAI